MKLLKKKYLIRIRNFCKTNKVIYMIYKILFRKIFIKYISKQTSKNLKKNGLETIEVIQKILLDEGISFSVIFGTLLGFIRDKKFISHDIDIDFALYSTFIDWKTLEERLNKKNFQKKKEFYFNGEITEQTYEYKGIQVDFFQANLENEKVVLNVYTRYNNVCYSSKNEFSLTKFYVSPFKKINLLKILNKYNIYIPDNAEQVLTEIYGKNWRIPDKNWKDEKSPAIKIFPNQYGYIKVFEEKVI